MRDVGVIALVVDFELVTVLDVLDLLFVAIYICGLQCLVFRDILNAEYLNFCELVGVRVAGVVVGLHVGFAVSLCFLLVLSRN